MDIEISGNDPDYNKFVEGSASKKEVPKKSEAKDTVSHSDASNDPASQTTDAAVPVIPQYSSESSFYEVVRNRRAMYGNLPPHLVEEWIAEDIVYEMATRGVVPVDKLLAFLELVLSKIKGKPIEKAAIDAIIGWEYAKSGGSKESLYLDGKRDMLSALPKDSSQDAREAAEFSYDMTFHIIYGKASGESKGSSLDTRLSEAADTYNTHAVSMGFVVGEIVQDAPSKETALHRLDLLEKMLKERSSGSESEIQDIETVIKTARNVVESIFSEEMSWSGDITAFLAQESSTELPPDIRG